MDLVGRDRELDDVERRLGSRRIVTITGPGGIGKTRLAREAAGRVDGRVGWVDLTRIDDAHDIAPVVADQLGYRDLDAVLSDPDDGEHVVVVDNCEHVLERASWVVSRLVGSRRSVRVLATSRSPLDLPEESVIPLGPLDLPDSESTGPSLDLLFACARDRGVDTGKLDSESAAEICRRLDGVPLAIEIAAARLEVRSAVELLDELHERQDRLARPRFRGQPTHRSVAEMVTWSIDLLPADVVSVFEELGVVAGPFTVDVATAIHGTDDVRDDLDRLVAASMLVADTSAADTRYRLLHPVRAVALDRLRRRDDHDVVMSRLVDHTLDRAVSLIGEAADGWGAALMRRAQDLFLPAMSAVRWTVENDEDPERSRAFVAVLWGIVHQAHAAEIVDAGEQVLARWPDPEGNWYANACATVATGRNLLGDSHGAIELATRTLEISSGSLFAATTLRRCLGQAHRLLGDAELSLEWFRSAAETARDAGLVGFALEITVDVGRVAAQLGDVEQGAAQIRDAIAEAERIGAVINVAWGYVALASLELDRDPADAERTARRGVEISRAADYPAGVSFGLHALAAAQIRLGRDRDAAATLLELLAELVGRGGLTDLRMVLGLTAELGRRHRRERWADLAVTAADLPVTSVAMDLHLEIADRALSDGRGTVLTSATAYRLCREELVAITTDAEPTSPVPDAGQVAGDVENDSPSAVRRGDVWELAYGGDTAIARASKGLDDLVALLAAPDREISSLDLMGAGVEGSAGLESLDDTARSAYERRVIDLQDEIEDADDAHDLHRAERLRIEMDALVDELTRAHGLGGRSRRTGSEAERARSAVTQRLRSTLRRIDDLHPALGRHLRSSITTGAFCSYRPDDDVRWSISR